MFKNATGSTKILALLFCLGAIQLTNSGCTRWNQDKTFYQFSSPQTNAILGGTKVYETDFLAKKVFYLAINSILLKTPSGYAARQDSFCSTIAITPSIAITAAHCLENVLPEKINLIEGVTPWLSPLKPELWHQGKHILIHPEYKKNQPEYDLALIYLSSPLSQESVMSIFDSDPKEMLITLTGFGFRINKIHSAQPEIHEKSDLLKNNSGELFYLTKTLKDYEVNQLIFSFEKSTTEAVCIGDSGGPALVFDQDAQSFAVIGLLSGSADSKKTQTFAEFENYDFCSETPVYTNLRHPEIRAWIERSIHQLTNHLPDFN